jgi:Tfp pilus assembly protein PilF
MKRAIRLAAGNGPAHAVSAAPMRTWHLRSKGPSRRGRVFEAEEGRPGAKKTRSREEPRTANEASPEGRVPGGRRALSVVALLMLAAVVAGCGHVPKVIVLEDPLSAQEHTALGVAYERKGELTLAAREYERALAKEKTYFQARVNLGNVRLAEKRYDAARQEYFEALSLRPGDAEATNNLAWAAILSGSGREEALRRMEAVLAEPARRTVPLLDTLGVLLGDLSRRREAEAAFAEAVRACDRGDPACTEAVRAEIRSHQEALRTTLRSPAGAPPLIR